MTEKRCMVFDLDGTLVDTRLDLANTVNLMLRYYGEPPLSLEQVVGMVGDGMKKLLERALANRPAGAAPIDFDEALEVMQRSYRANLNLTASLYPGVYVTLKELQAKGWKLAVLTNKPDDFCKSTLYDLGIAPFFNVILGGTPDFPLKPAPDGMQFILDILGIEDPSDCWMVGDGAPDLLVGKAVGMKTAFAAYGFGNDLNGATYDIKIDRFEQLKEL